MCPRKVVNPEKERKRQITTYYPLFNIVSRFIEDFHIHLTYMAELYFQSKAPGRYHRCCPRWWHPLCLSPACWIHLPRGFGGCGRFRGGRNRFGRLVRQLDQGRVGKFTYSVRKPPEMHLCTSEGFLTFLYYE